MKEDAKNFLLSQAKMNLKQIKMEWDKTHNPLLYHWALRVLNEIEYLNGFYCTKESKAEINKTCSIRYNTSFKDARKKFLRKLESIEGVRFVFDDDGFFVNLDIENGFYEQYSIKWERNEKGLRLYLKYVFTQRKDTRDFYKTLEYILDEYDIDLFNMFECEDGQYTEEELEILEEEYGL